MANKDKTSGAALQLIMARVGSRPQPARKPAIQRRRAERKPANKPISLWRYSDGVAAEAENAVLVNISTGGIGLVLATPMEKGTAFLVHLTPDDSSLVYCAVQCRPCAGESYRVGAKFVSRVSADKGGSLQQDIDRIRQAILG